MNSPSGLSRPSGTQLNYQHCPSCGSDGWKVYQNPDTGAWICFRCNARGCADVGVTKDRLLLQLERRVTRREWPEMLLPKYEPLSRSARLYLQRRGISDPARYGIVELAESTRVLIPYRGPLGRVVYWTTRSYLDDGQPKYMTAPGRHPLYVLPGPDMVVVEGVFDAIAVRQNGGRGAVALGGKTIPAYLRAELRELSPATIMLDGDALKDALRLKQELPDAKIHMLPVGVDPAEYYKGVT